MTNSINSYVKIWVWESNLENSMAAPEYGHVALETFQQERSRYMSFCLKPQCSHKPETLNGYPAHFHENKEDDDALQEDKIACAYQLSFLDISKINRAFKTFKANPNAWGALGYALLGRAYSFNACGLTVFLLDEGKIFDLPIYQNAIEPRSLIQKIISGFGMCYSTINGWLSYQSFSLAKQLEEPNNQIKDYAASFKNVHNHWSSTLRSQAIPKNCPSQKHLNDPDTLCSHCVKGLKKIDSFETLFIKDFNSYPWQEWYQETKGFTDIARSISKRLFIIATVTAVAVVTINYINNRIEGRYEARDIVLLVEKAAHAENAYCAKVVRVAFPEILT